MQNLKTIDACDLCLYRGPFEVLYPAADARSSLKEHNDYRSSSETFAIEGLDRCPRCKLAFLNPQIPPADILSGYTDAIDDDYISQADARRRSFKKSLTWLTAELARRGKTLKPGAQVLDVGCAAGFFLREAQDAGFEAYGIEPSRFLVDWGQKNLGVRSYAGTIEDSGRLPVQKFDLITLWDVLEHTDSPKATLERVVSLLKPGGMILLNYPDFSSVFAKVLKRKWWFFLSVHLYYFTPETIARYLEQFQAMILVDRKHIQELELDYLLKRAGAYLPRLSAACRKGIGFLGLGRMSVPYYASQRLCVAEIARSA